MKPDNDNPDALTQALHLAMQRNLDELSSNLAEALRSTVEANDMVAKAVLDDASRNVRHITSIAKHFDKHGGD